MKPTKILIIQTAFIGDVILATPLIEKLDAFFPESAIDFLVRKGNEALLSNHPKLNEVLIWNKKERKYGNFIKVIRRVRAQRYDIVINLQRFLSTGLITALSGAREKAGFKKNPLSAFFSIKKIHEITPGVHEVHRNLSLIEHLTNEDVVGPKLYPAKQDVELVKRESPYVCIAPTSVWYTKQWPAKKWIGLINRLDRQLEICLIGGPSDQAACEDIRLQAEHPKVYNLAGQYSLLQSAALMAGAKMNYVNDSAPLHIASAMNAPVTAIFCSTIPAFGFTPLSDVSQVAETQLNLECRPCGLHGFNACPEGHFKCVEIELEIMH